MTKPLRQSPELSCLVDHGGLPCPGYPSSLQSKEITDEELEKEASVLQDQIAAYLKKRGWKIVLVDGFRIEQRDPSKKMKFEFVMGFVGQDIKKIEELKKPKNERT